ncbi:Dirigent protein - like 2 [Theobroma cacao]|uniref:Dirigent protein n=1 Tax=Theobroma cacao TaxID=3641 RepID=A0AB32ULQ2_THECC|nr:PREDICTED: dirigent protein 9 [Theobroma cacao]WRX11546.1 Dirigent protein - like 2 [Theobroma cacao]
MAKTPILLCKTLKATIYFLFLAIIFTCANSARVLDEVEAQPQVVDDIPQPSNPAATTVPPNTLPSGQVRAATPSGSEDDDDTGPQLPEAPAAAAAPAEDEAPVATPAAPAAGGVAPIAVPTATSATTGAGAAAAASATVATPGSHDPVLSFFMHDILGGSHPSARVVTGIIANSEVSGIPFSKTNNDLFPVQGAAPLLNGNNINDLKNINNLINPNNVPFLTGLTGAQTNAILQNSGNNNNVLNGDSQPFVTAGQLPPGSLQRLMFGSITVIDDELTEAHELGSAVLGRAQGFYLASSLDGSSQTIALTVLLHGGEHGHELEDAISFFGVHRTVSPASQIAVVGGTGKYENARGYATVETLHQEDQHITDGVDTILHFNVYLID